MSSSAIVVRVEVKHIQPCIWRVLRLPGDLRLRELHQVLQLAMGWADRSPHTFEFNGHGAGTAVTAGGTPAACAVDENLTLAQALTIARVGFTYVYEVEGAWRVRITRAAGVWRAGSKAAIVCLDGYLAGPRDDSLGALAYTAILAATLGHARQLTHDEAQRLGPNFDPERFDRCALNRALARLRAQA